MADHESSAAERPLSEDASLLIAQAERAWDAERENAERYAARARILVPLASAILGFAFLAIFREVPLQQIQESWVDHPSARFLLSLSFLILSAAGIGMLVLGLATLIVSGGFPLATARWLLHRPLSKLKRWKRMLLAALPRELHREYRVIRLARKEAAKTASNDLDLPIDRPESLRARGEESAAEVLALIQTATLSLRVRNTNRRRELRSCESRLAIGTLLFSVAVILFMVSTLRPPMNSEGKDAQDGNPSCPQTEVGCRGSDCAP